MRSDIQEKEKDENRKQSDKKMCSFGSITQKKCTHYPRAAHVETVCLLSKKDK